MRVAMLSHFTGTRDGVEWPPAGGVIDVPDHEARDLIANGYAEEAPDEEAAAPAEPAEDGPDEAPAEDSGEAAAPEPVDLDSLDKAQLTALAAERGVDVDARWGEKRLREALAED